LSVIRGELLREHAAIRVILDEVLEAADRWRGHRGVREELRLALGRLAVAMVAHNEHEEEVLRGVMPTIDAWGPARAEIMGEEHLAEHEELSKTVIEAGSTDDAEVAWSAVAGLADRLAKHMAHEEKSFLGEDVLNDDVPLSVDYFGG